eukprot:scaffold4756_cov116-Isochrysis_galbana.AAC.11
MGTSAVQHNHRRQCPRQGALLRRPASGATTAVQKAEQQARGHNRAPELGVHPELCTADRIPPRPQRHVAEGLVPQIVLGGIAQHTRREAGLGQEQRDAVRNWRVCQAGRAGGRGGQTEGRGGRVEGRGGRAGALFRRDGRQRGLAGGGSRGGRDLNRERDGHVGRKMAALRGRRNDCTHHALPQRPGQVARGGGPRA